MGWMRGVGLLVWLCASVAAVVNAQSTEAIDTDRDGMSDVREQMLLEKFMPRFQVSRTDCAVMPAIV